MPGVLDMILKLNVKKWKLSLYNNIQHKTYDKYEIRKYKMIQHIIKEEKILGNKTLFYFLSYRQN